MALRVSWYTSRSWDDGEGDDGEEEEEDDDEEAEDAGVECRPLEDACGSKQDDDEMCFMPGVSVRAGVFGAHHKRRDLLALSVQTK